MFNVNEEINDIIDEINDDFCESAYEEIFEELCYRVECGELSLEDAEIINEAAYDRYVLEDNSDVAAVNYRKLAEQKYRSKYGISKRPKITKNMSDMDKWNLKNYDHGNSADNSARVMSTRGAGDRRDKTRLRAVDKRCIDLRNNPDDIRAYKKYINGENEIMPFGYSGMGSKRNRKRNK